ncbi:unnamed protein product [Diatraea saccharalis]|uniref:Uncharacterized protein n=1 Tax=Diatraea saccharalis TaxID=40085 RepID=A0A9N9QVC0_9NEOP|nr:unnamed protein product [Diatraea saccharalis]
MSGGRSIDKERKSPRESGEDSEDESEILEESPCGRWLKRREEGHSGGLGGDNGHQLTFSRLQTPALSHVIMSYSSDPLCCALFMSCASRLTSNDNKAQTIMKVRLKRLFRGGFRAAGRGGRGVDEPHYRSS